MPQYNRVISLTVGQVGGQAKIISDLRIVFNIIKTEDKDPNTAQIEIYNLSQSTRDLIKDNGEFVILNAGYVDGTGEELLFTGNITSISHKKMLPGVLTTINADDGSNALFSSKISISHQAGVSGATILNNVLSSIPIPNNSTSISISNKAYANGFSFAGLSKTALTKVTKFLELDWTIQNNEIVLSNFDSNDETQVILLSSNTGLLGSPERVMFSTRKSKGISKKDIPGWKFVSLLQPKILPRGRVAVSSNEIPDNTVFIVVSVTHTGDTFGKEFTTSIEVKE